MSALIYTQLGVSPYTQKQTGFAGCPARKDLNFSHITVYKKKKRLPSRRVETAAQQALWIKIKQNLERTLLLIANANIQPQDIRPGLPHQQEGYLVSWLNAITLLLSKVHFKTSCILIFCNTYLKYLKTPIIRPPRLTSVQKCYSMFRNNDQTTGFVTDSVQDFNSHIWKYYKIGWTAFRQVLKAEGEIVGHVFTLKATCMSFLTGTYKLTGVLTYIVSINI